MGNLAAFIVDELQARLGAAYFVYDPAAGSAEIEDVTLVIEHDNGRIEKIIHGVRAQFTRHSIQALDTLAEEIKTAIADKTRR
jgi:hypothetical protein